MPKAAYIASYSTRYSTPSTSSVQKSCISRQTRANACNKHACQKQLLSPTQHGAHQARSCLLTFSCQTHTDESLQQHMHTHAAHLPFQSYIPHASLMYASWLGRVQQEDYACCHRCCCCCCCMLGVLVTHSMRCNRRAAAAAAAADNACWAW